MKRFQGNSNSYGRDKHGFLRGAFVSVSIFVVVLAGFLFAIGKTTSSTDIEQRKILVDAIEKSVIQCYITEGRYPENFSYVEDKYNIIYDKNKYRVDYRVYGTNMMPEIQVIDLED